MRLLFLLTLSVSGLFAQPTPVGWISGGFKIGSPVNDPPNTFGFLSTYTQSRWTGGPTVEVLLPFRFAIEFDVLYRTSRNVSTYNFGYGTALNPFTSSNSERVNSWDLPLLLKYRIPAGKIRPFISVGYQFTHESIKRLGYVQCVGPEGSCTPPDFPPSGLPGSSFSQESRWRGGPAAGAGLEFQAGWVTITPEARFSRFINTYPHDNRVTGLVGFTFGQRK